MIIFKYNKKVNKEVWEEITSAGRMFGYDFPQMTTITTEDERQARKIVSQFNIWLKGKEKKMRDGLSRIYKFDLPTKITCYITTSKFCTTWKGSPVISMHRNSSIRFYTNLVHELSHILYYDHYGKDENIKEVITVINNVEIEGVDDRGWPIFQKQREKALKIWAKTRDIGKVIRAVEPLVRNIK